MSGINDLWPFALIGFLFAATPWIGVAGLVVVPVLHFWLGVSLAWISIPAALLLVWVLFLLVISRHD